MKKEKRIGLGFKVGRALLPILLMSIALPSSVSYSESNTGVDADKVPDLDDVIQPEPDTKPPREAAAEKTGDADAVADLEKAMEDDKPKPVATNKRAAPAPSEGSDPEDLEAMSKGGDDALGLPSDKDLKNAPPATAARDAAGTDDLEAMAKEDGGAPAPAGDAGGADPLDLPGDANAPNPAAGVATAPPANDAPPVDDGTAVTDLEPAPAPPPVAPPPKRERPARTARRDEPLRESRNRITNLEFKMDGAKSRLVVSSGGPLRFREVRNPQTKQVVYFFDNTETPQKLQRAYDTTEFTSPVALFTLLQLPRENPPLSKLIVQLREEKMPTAVPNDRGLVIEFEAPDAKKGTDQRLVIGDADERLNGEENLYSGGKSFTGKNIQRLEVKNSDIQDVLRLIAKSSGYNIVVGDDVTGKVGTLSLENIPWDQAFALVLQSKKLGYIRTGNVLRVGTLNALKSEKEEALANEQSRIKVENLRTVLIPVSYAKASDLAPQAKNFLTERGTIDVDVRTNTIIVKDIEKVVGRIQKLYQALDTQPPRVAISAKFVEVNEKFTHDLGLANATASNIALGGLNLSPQFSAKDPGGLFTGQISAPNFASLLTTLQIGETEEKVRTIANPSISVVANQPALVRQEFNFFIPVNTIANGITTQALQPVKTSLELNVTPLVAGDGSIFLTINLRNEIPSGSGASTTVDGRNVQTQILIENGDTAVVGGIFSNTAHTTRQGVPILMHVPVLGYLLSNNHRDSSRNELFVFLTAKIMNAEESFKRTF